MTARSYLNVLGPMSRRCEKTRQLWRKISERANVVVPPFPASHAYNIV